MTSFRRTPARPGPRRHDISSLAPDPRPADKDPDETAEPYDLPFPEDRWPPGRPEYVIVVDQLRGLQPGQPLSIAELLETTRTRTRQPEPDLEAEL
jgi:hypothetical protein